MTKRIGSAAGGVVLAVALASGAVAAPTSNGHDKRFEAPMTRSASARHLHHARYADRPVCPEYIDRPCYYAPAPFFPLPPIYGYGWEWW